MKVGYIVEIEGSDILWTIVDIDKSTVDLVDSEYGVIELHGVPKDDIIDDTEE